MRKAMFFTSPYIYETWGAYSFREIGSVNLSSDFDIIRATCMSDDGTKFYVAGDYGSTWVIKQYSTPAAHRILPALSYQSQATLNHLPSSSNAKIRGIFLGDSGSKLYIVCNTFDGTASSDNAIYQYNLSTAWDISTASYASKSFATDALATGKIGGISAKTDGLKFYVSGKASGSLYEIDLSVAWDISTASYSGVSVNADTREWVFIGDDGNAVFGGRNTVHKYILTSAFDINPPIFEEESISTTKDYATFSRNGWFLFGHQQSSSDRKVYQYRPLKNISETTAYGGNSEFMGYQRVDSNLSRSDNVVFRPGGTKIYVLGDDLSSNAGVAEFTLPSEWTILNGSLTFNAFKAFTHTFEAAAPLDIAFSTDGTKLYVVNNKNGGTSADNKIHQYDLSTAWDISTATYSSKSFATDSIDTRVVSLFFQDGNTLFLYGRQNSRVYKLTLSTAWDISTASYGGVYVGVVSDQNALRFSSDGTRMVLMTGSMNVYTLSTAWDITTAGAASSTRLYGTGVRGGDVTSDGTAVITCDHDSSSGKVFIFEHRLTN